MTKKITKTKKKILDTLEDKKELEDWEIDEKLSEYDDRQIVVSVLNILNKRQMIKLLEELEESFG